MSESFFGRNGTMNGAMNVANSIAGMKSDKSSSALGRLVGIVMKLFA